jgi:hypothetical protein
MLEALEGSRDVFALLAGMKKQAMDAGFSEEIAEQIVLEMLKKQSA